MRTRQDSENLRARDRPRSSQTPAGDTTPVAAAVRVPLTYFAALYTKENPGGKDPTEKQMRGLIDAAASQDSPRCDDVHGTEVRTPTSPWKPISIPTPSRAASQTATAGISIGAAGRRTPEGNHSWRPGAGEPVHGVDGGEEGHACSGRGAVAAAAAPSRPAPVLDTGNELVGEVGSGGNTLDGMELDDDAIRTQQMLEQVSSLVKENPDSAATLVKRWLNRAVNVQIEVQVPRHRVPKSETRMKSRAEIRKHENPADVTHLIRNVLLVLISRLGISDSGFRFRISPINTASTSMALAPEITGVRKAAVLLLSLNQDEAAEILRRLPPEAVEEVSREIASLGEIPNNMRGQVFGEFYSLALANSYLSEGGLEYAKTLLQERLARGGCRQGDQTGHSAGPDHSVFVFAKS